MRFRGRSYLAFMFVPEPPVADWLAELDANLARSPEFFVGRAVVLDLSQVQMSSAGIAQLIASLRERNIRIMGVEGVDPALVGPDLPPVLKGGKSASSLDLLQTPLSDKPAAAPKPSAQAAQSTSLLLESPVRSGQSIIFMEGDVTVLGSVGSGAEVVAGGSIHIYGTLRGRAMAGVSGNARARIFCHKIEAELLAIDGFYKTAEDIDARLRSRPVQAWLEGSTMNITALN
jgi:septum site-determining protein MinC